MAGGGGARCLPRRAGDRGGITVFRWGDEACAGVRRVVSLGRAGGMPPGLSHDGFRPLRRLIRRVNDEWIGL
ncbi:hypothetical protein [Streptomyces sp. NPDC058086]|uniref:hypothetical protein n=1 Tax=Streptomyces sp. NPDC058086 TaxID=3346334 RepID=UPI0036E10A2E